MQQFGISEALSSLGVKKKNPGSSTGQKWFRSSGVTIESYSPADGKLIGGVVQTDEKTYYQVVKKSSEAFREWRKWPAPKRGEVVRQIGEALRKQKQNLGKLVSYEMGKSY